MIQDGVASKRSLSTPRWCALGRRSMVVKLTPCLCFSLDSYSPCHSLNRTHSDGVPEARIDTRSARQCVTYAMRRTARMHESSRGISTATGFNWGSATGTCLASREHFFVGRTTGGFNPLHGLMVGNTEAHSLMAGNCTPLL